MLHFSLKIIFWVRTQGQNNSLVLYSLLPFLLPSCVSLDLSIDTTKLQMKLKKKNHLSPTDSYISTPNGRSFLFQDYLTSGVTSRGANPVPPVVKIKLSSFSSHQSISVSWKRIWILSDLPHNKWDTVISENTWRLEMP